MAISARRRILVLPTVVGDLSVFGDIAGWLYGVDKSNGADAGVRTEPVYAEGMLLARTEDGARQAIW